MITQLTHEQEAQLSVYAEKWKQVALSTKPANRPEAERGVRLAYELVSLQIPKQIVWCDSPMAMFLEMDDTLTSVRPLIVQFFE